LEKRDAEYMKECVAKMPKECRALYLNFMKLKRETRSLKNNLNTIKNKKASGYFAVDK